jgi:two-component system, OmpR family, phosphate regulon sensor histidine kinase PhoR
VNPAVPRRLTFALILCCAVAAALLTAPFLGQRAALAALFTLLAGALLGSLISKKRSGTGALRDGAGGRSTAPPGTATTNREAGRTGALLEATMNCMREGVLVVDQGTRVVASNRAALDIFGDAGRHLEGRRLSELTRIPDVYAAFDAALNREEAAEVKVEMRESDRVTFDLRVVPLRLDDQEGTRGAIGVFFDITRLERLERVRQEFLSNVSHELRTPLTAIIAFVETLEGGAMGDPENSRRFISIIGRNAARMHSLINDILELSAIEAGTVFIEARPVRLWQMVNDVTTSLASRAEARGVTLVNEVPPDTVVFADPRRLEQMLTNLVDNAIKFNREGGSVAIRHEREARDRISVTDAGDGIPPEHIKRIFERFYRVDRARSREMGGTGLGLAIVKHLARAHGGEASVHSTPGVGSTFTVELPPAPASCEPATSAPGQSNDEPGTRILPQTYSSSR